MEKKRRFRKFLSSIFGTHIDAKKTDILENKKDIEKNVEKILKLISEKESDASANSLDKSELASLIKDFHKGYQTLLEHYDGLSTKLKKKVHHERGSGSFSYAFGTSESNLPDLGSEEIYNKERSNEIQEWKVEVQSSLEDYLALQEQLEDAKRSKNELQVGEATMVANLSDFERLSDNLAERQVVIEKLENNLQSMAESVRILQTENGDLKQKLEILSQKEVDMNQRMRSFSEQNENLISENTKAFSWLHDAEKDIEKCKLENEQVKDEISKLASDNREMKQEMEERAHLVDYLIRQLSNTNKEKEALRSERFIFWCKIHETQKALADLRDESNRLSIENKQLLSENEKLKLKLEDSQRNGDELNWRLAACDKGKGALESEILKSSYQKQEAKNSIKNQKLTTDMLFFVKKLLLSVNECLKLEQDGSRRTGDELNQRSAASEEENRALESEIVRSLLQIQEAENTIKNLTMDSKVLKYEHAKLLNTVNDLCQQTKAKIKEIYALKSEHKELMEKAHETWDKEEILMMEIENIKNMNPRLLLNYEDPGQELKARTQEASELKQSLDATNDEKHSLTTENLALSSKIQKDEINLNDLGAQIEQLENDKSQLLVRVNGMGLELDEANLQLTGLNNKLEAAADKINTVTSENSWAMCKLKQANAHNKELENKLKQLKEENSILQEHKSKMEVAMKIINNLKNEADQLRPGKSRTQIEIDDLNLKLETMNLQLTDQNREIGVAGKEKNALTSELEHAEGNVKKLEIELQQLRDEKSMLQQNNEDLYDQNTNLESRLEERAEVLSLSVSDKLEVPKEASIHANELQMELDLLHIQQNNVQEHMKIIRDGCLENQILMNNLINKLSKIFIQETTLEELSSSFLELLKTCEQFKDQCWELHAKFHSAEIVSKDQKKQINNLVGNCNELLEKILLSETEKAQANKEIAKLHEQVQTLKVQLHLSNQKLEITETENKEKEEKHKRMVELFQKKCTELEEMYASGKKLDFLENELMKVKTAVNPRISALDMRLHELEALSEQQHSQILSRLLIYTEELKTMKSKLEEQIYEKEMLIKEEYELTVRLECKDGMILMLKDEAGSLGAKLAEKEKDIKKLMKSVHESQKKMEELEKRVKEKEEEVLAKNDEKREAIMQLCLLTEYHREKCDYLVQYLSAMLKRTGRSM